MSRPAQILGASRSLWTTWSPGGSGALSSARRLGRQPDVRVGTAVCVVPAAPLQHLHVEPCGQHACVRVEQLAGVDAVVQQAVLGEGGEQLGAETEPRV